MTTALIDADIVAYRAAAVSQENIDWQDGNEGPTISKQQALASAQFIIGDWTQRADCNKSILCFGGSDNFRKEIFPDYKGNRKGEPPELLGETIEYLKLAYESYAVHRLEADDLMSIFATSEYVKSAIIVSIDKDMQTVPAFVFNPDKDNRPRRIRLAQANYTWMHQTLIGDRVDNYKGIPGVGPKKAEKILARTGPELPDLWASVLEAYLEAGLTEQDAITQARLSRILRAEDYHSDKKEITLWHPQKKSLTLSIDPVTTSTSTEGKNPLTSSLDETSTSLKATSSSTSSGGAKRAARKTSRRRSSTSKGSSKRQRKTNTITKTLR